MIANVLSGKPTPLTLCTHHPNIPAPKRDSGVKFSRLTPSPMHRMPESPRHVRPLESTHGLPASLSRASVLLV